MGTKTLQEAIEHREQVAEEVQLIIGASAKGIFQSLINS
jgi:hypothetical protein